MGRTGTNLVQGVGRKLSIRCRFVSAAGTGGAGTYTDATNLRDTGVDWYNNMYLYHGTGAKDYRVTDDDGAGVLTLDTGDTPASTSDYELLPLPSARILDALNRAARRLEHRLGRTRIDNSYVTNSPIFNAGFEDTTTSTAIDGWQKSGTTMTRMATADLKLGGAYSVRLDTASGYIEPTAEYQNMLHDLQGYAPTLYYPCKTSIASNARLSWVIDGTTTNGSYHSGGGGWETLSVTAPSIADPVDTITFRLNVAASTFTAYFDNGWIENGPTLYNYRLPDPMKRGPSYIRVQDIGDRDIRWQFPYRRLWNGWQFIREEDPAISLVTTSVTRNMLVVKRPPSFGRWFMAGWEPLNALSSTRTDVMEVDVEQAELLELEAAILLITEAGRPEHRQRLADLSRQRDELQTRFSDVLGAVQLS